MMTMTTIRWTREQRNVRPREDVTTVEVVPPISIYYKCLIYQRLKEVENHPCKMLAIADDHWLRKELEERRKLLLYEKAQGEMAYQEADPTDRNGGYASGRNIKLA